jgi:hypothetical protein
MNRPFNTASRFFSHTYESFNLSRNLPAYLPAGVTRKAGNNGVRTCRTRAVERRAVRVWTMTTPMTAGEMRKQITLAGMPPCRGLSRLQAATYIGISPTLFDEMVADGRMPKPKMINARRLYDRFALDAAFTELPDVDEENPWG